MALLSPRAPRPLALGVIGAAIVAFPSCVAFVVIDATTGDDEWKLTVGAIAVLFGIAGVAIGALFGAALGHRPELPTTGPTEPGQPAPA